MEIKQHTQITIKSKKKSQEKLENQRQMKMKTIYYTWDAVKTVLGNLQQ